jgi:hypothetical protein
MPSSLPVSRCTPIGDLPPAIALDVEYLLSKQGFPRDAGQCHPEPGRLKYLVVHKVGPAQPWMLQRIGK